MIDRNSALPIVRQCDALGLCRSALYYQPRPLSEADLRLIRALDELHLQHPFLGARKLAQLLTREGFALGRRHVGTLMRLMGIEPLYRKRRTSLPQKGHKIYPYLLGAVAIERPNQVWSADITYLPMARGFAYLVALLDLASRKVLAFRVSNALSGDFCVEALEEALAKYGPPEIFNTDQGAQFTAEAFTSVLGAKGIRISMDGKGRWIDNVFVERLWRSVKYEHVYLRAYDSPKHAARELKSYFEFYNAGRPHQALAYRMPDEVYFERTNMSKAA
jgi:putative transposase